MCSNDNPTTRSIVTDYFNWRLKNKTITNNRLFIIIRKLAYDCETIYYSQQPIFNVHLSSSIIDLQNIHYEITTELFNDGTITWSRIITFISFSAILAEYFIQQQQQNMDFFISSIIDWTTNFIDINLHTWLESQNYWTGCLKIYDKTSQRRNSISRYASILGTIGKYITMLLRE
ncbi:unnamed protein product [Rotaria sp. Silwood1]|nr:unnamed protein product [Rotaria sp. Silwood1]CAF3392100.1 unnamed protein product [Rotaria sp. Silwood1]CAF4661382.1 unnamed protein product [Rotaria sp. Silwood1]